METAHVVEPTVVHCVKHQENRMLSPVCEACSPDLDFNTHYVKNGYRHQVSSGLQAAMETLISENKAAEENEAAAGALGNKKKLRPKNRRKSMSMSVIRNNPNFEENHNCPLMYWDDNDASNVAAGKDQKSFRRHNNPLRQIGNLLGCLVGVKQQGSCEKKSRGKKSQSLALLELSQRQKDALTVKQDTIELLEWKLEQLQLLSSSCGDLPPSPQHSTSSPGSQNPFAPNSGFPEHQHAAETQSFSNPRYNNNEEVVSKSRHDNRTLNPQAQNRSRELKPQTIGDIVSKCGHDLILSPLVQTPNQDLTLQSAAELESAIFYLFDMTVVKARLAVRYFCKIFMSQMEVSGYSVLRTLAEIEPNTKFLKKDHAAFILESRLNKALYHSFENDSFDENGITQIIDPKKRCMIRFRDFQRLKGVDAAVAVNNQSKDFDHEFWTFSESKMREMWFLFPWNVVFKDSEQRSTFTGAFLDAAKSVWLLHRLAFSVHSQVTIVRVGKGMLANCQYVEQVSPMEEQCRKCEGPKIEFMTMPGFQTKEKIIKCQYYRHLQCPK